MLEILVTQGIAWSENWKNQNFATKIYNHFTKNYSKIIRYESWMQ